MESREPPDRTVFEVRDLESKSYEDARREQDAACDRVLGWRGASMGNADPADSSVTVPAGVILTVEHDPVITVSKRAGAADHVLGSPEQLASSGVRVVPTDRGGDVTYHGPGQLVVYPIVDLNRLGLRIHSYMRCLEQAVIDTLGEFDVRGERDPDATGVWVRGGPEPNGMAKICAMGVRVRRWVTLHGLALNVQPDLEHFGLINPCGLGRPVTSMHEKLGANAPKFSVVRAVLVDRLQAVLGATGERRSAHSPAHSTVRKAESFSGPQSPVETTTPHEVRARDAD